MTEEQNYRVITREGEVELRAYDRCTVADVHVEGTAERAGNAAFRPLASYINGQNLSKGKLAMTAPVIQEPAGQQLAMTAPVLQEEGEDGSWIVSFVLPGGRGIDAYPEPSDSRVTLREVPPSTAAALRWSGRWTAANVAKRTKQLMAAVEAAGWIVEGQPRWARYDPPWKPAFARRNEIVVSVRLPIG